MNNLDQFYTPEETAKKCIDITLNYIPKNEKIKFIEPSAGKGVFVKLLEEMGYDIDCYDIEPKYEKCKQKNFLLHKETKLNNYFYCAIGNPPYGKKGAMAVKFINKCLNLYDMVAFIVPKTLGHSYLAQKKIIGKLIFNENLDNYEFENEGKIVKVPSYFQIWVNYHDERFVEYEDLRLKAPLKEIDELEIKIYNKTETAKKWLNWDWDIAIKRTSKKGEYILDKNKITDEYHWILIKAKSKEALEILKQIDWSVANDGKMTAGISKSDVIDLYLKYKKGE
jgi:hypothetical protein